jgi:hypothetical protein
MLLPARWLRQAIFVVISGRARPHAEIMWLLCLRPATAVQSCLDRAVPARPRRQLSGQPPSTPAGGGLPPAHRAVGSTVAAPKGAPWPPFTPQAPSLPPESRRACGRDAVATREAPSRVHRGRIRRWARARPPTRRRARHGCARPGLTPFGRRGSHLPRRRAVCAQAPCAPRAERCCVRAVAGPGDGPGGGARRRDVVGRRGAAASPPHPHLALTPPPRASCPPLAAASPARLTRSPLRPSPTHSVRSPVARPCGGRLSLAAATRGGDGGGREGALRAGRRGGCPAATSHQPRGNPNPNPEAEAEAEPENLSPNRNPNLNPEPRTPP